MIRTIQVTVSVNLEARDENDLQEQISEIDYEFWAACDRRKPLACEATNWEVIPA